MDIWLSRCNKTVRCAYCLEDITPGEPAIFGKLWLRFTGEGAEPRRWVKNFRWHGKRNRDGQCCWLVNALEEFARRPYVETRGRKRLLMSKERRDRRLFILRQRARLVQRLKFLMLATPDSVDIDEIIKIGSKMENLREQIALVGGAPKSWD